MKLLMKKMNIRNYKGLRDGRVSFEQNNIVIGKGAYASFMEWFLEPFPVK